MSTKVQVPAQISSNEPLNRRFPPEVYNEEERRINSNAFYSGKNPSEISVDRAWYRKIEETLSVVGNSWGVAQILTYEICNIAGMSVESSPLPDNDAHANVIVEVQSKSQLRKKIKALTALAQVIHEPKK
jgi:hypothetical protein